MKHLWKSVPGEDARVCENCGARQHWHYKHEWRQNKGRYWSPRVGRCKGKPQGKPLIDVFTVKRDALARMAAINSKDLPHLIEDGGRRKRWVGIGWIDEGPADGTEVLVVD